MLNVKNCCKVLLMIFAILVFFANCPILASIVAVESFDYETGDLNGKGTAENGWKGAWLANENTTHGTGAIVENSLNMSNLLFDPVGGSLTGQYYQATRELESSNGIRFDQDGTYYISVLTQRTGLTASGDWLYLTLQTGAGNDIATFGINSSDEFLTTGLGAYQHLGNAAADEVYFLVCKIITSADSNDEIYLKSYSESDTIDSVETTDWTISGSNADVSLTAEKIYLDVGWKDPYSANMDEIRIGTEWSDVVVPEPATLFLTIFGSLFVAKGSRCDKK